VRAVDIIAKKRDGEELTREEICFFIDGYVRDEIADYQAAAWAMAVVWRGMTDEETIHLTQAMVDSGETLDMSRVGDVVVDKHSSGGVGDKTTLVVAPLVSAAGLPVAKMSGRGLGFTGGTLDKLESIPGFDVSLDREQFFETVQQHGIVVAGQTARLVPADGKLYALRDVTATIPSLPLIASSIMSKKIAGGADAIVLDVKVGEGAFMRSLDEARALAELMIRIGDGVGRRVTAVLSNMNQPLGRTVGNALEVREAIETLQGRGPSDVVEHCMAIAGEMLVLGNTAENPEAARATLERLLDSGQALQQFRRWVRAQGGDDSVVDDPDRLPTATVTREVKAPRAGYVAAVNAREVGLTAVALGAGRERKGEAIEPAVGIVVRAKVGDRLEAGDPLFVVHATNDEDARIASERLLRACVWQDEPVEAPPLIHDIIRGV
jgi:pyrimidine-nucleoside phosphorylase